MNRIIDKNQLNKLKKDEYDGGAVKREAHFIDGTQFRNIEKYLKAKKERKR